MHRHWPPAIALYTLMGCLIAGACNTPSGTPWGDHGSLVLSEDRHYIEHEKGTPFFWIGDTGWAMFQQLTREEVDRYLDNRKVNGFTVIQSVAFWFPHGGNIDSGPLNAPNAYGHPPFEGDAASPATSNPLVLEEGSPLDPADYWDHADYVVNAVRERGLYLALLPVWGNAFINNRMPGSSIEFDREEARAYGEFLGRRYGDEPHIIWVLGGDVDPVNFGDQDQRDVYRAMAEGIGRGVSGNESLTWNTPASDWDRTFMTFHAVQAPWLNGGEGGSSSLWFHDDPWLDVNMMETYVWTDRVYPLVREDYALYPVKPTLLGEGAYEWGAYGQECGWVSPLRVRRQAYQAVFAGAAGVTYGHHAIWAFRGEDCGQSWETGIEAPGARQVGFVLRGFLSAFDVRNYVPDQSLLINPGEGEERLCAMRQKEGGGWMFYFPSNKPAAMDTDRAGSIQGTVTWIDPRTGVSLAPVSFELPLMPPSDWEDAIAVVHFPSKLV